MLNWIRITDFIRIEFCLSKRALKGRGLEIATDQVLLGFLSQNLPKPIIAIFVIILWHFVSFIATIISNEEPTFTIIPFINY